MSLALELEFFNVRVKVNLSWTRTGDGALRALAGKRKLYDFASGNDVTDAGIPLLHELRDRGMQHMRGLDGLSGLNLDDSHLAITAAALEPLASLPHLGGQNLPIHGGA